MTMIALLLASDRSALLRTNRVFQNLGGAFASMGEHQLAFASFQRAIDLDPSDRYTYFKLGMMYEQLGEWKDSVRRSVASDDDDESHGTQSAVVPGPRSDGPSKHRGQKGNDCGGLGVLFFFRILCIASARRADCAARWCGVGVLCVCSATGKFKEAGEHALQCYQFYLEGPDGRRDADAFTIYGNLLLERLYPAEAIAAYQK
jgi:tetratricopeptide (TPR) repeat protein